MHPMNLDSCGVFIYFLCFLLIEKVRLKKRPHYKKFLKIALHGIKIPRVSTSSSGRRRREGTPH